jgi:hypothetical protein
LERLLGNSPREEQNVNIFTWVGVLELHIWCTCFHNGHKKGEMYCTTWAEFSKNEVLKSTWDSSTATSSWNDSTKRISLGKRQDNNGYIESHKNVEMYLTTWPHLGQDRTTTAISRAVETTQQREPRLEKDRTTTATSRETETSQQRRERLEENRIRMTETRQAVMRLNLSQEAFIMIAPTYIESRATPGISASINIKETSGWSRSWFTKTGLVCYIGNSGQKLQFIWHLLRQK